MYAQILIGASFILASYQDFHDRAVSDLVWIPAVIGAGLALYLGGQYFALQLFKIALIGGVGFAFAFYGGIGEADAIAMALIAADPNPISPFQPLIFAAVFAVAHVMAEFIRGNVGRAKVIPMERFIRELKWIPKAVIKDGVRTEANSDVNVSREEVAADQSPGTMVEVAYGVPTVAYLGLGYAAYLVFLLLLYPGAFFSLP